MLRISIIELKAVFRPSGLSTPYFGISIIELKVTIASLSNVLFSCRLNIYNRIESKKNYTLVPVVLKRISIIELKG